MLEPVCCRRAITCNWFTQNETNDVIESVPYCVCWSATGPRVTNPCGDETIRLVIEGDAGKVTYGTKLLSLAYGFEYVWHLQAIA